MTNPTNFIEPEDESSNPKPRSQQPDIGRAQALRPLVAPDRTRQPVRQAVDAPDQDSAGSIPAALRKRYLVAEGKYHFRDGARARKIAFEDRGMRIQTEHDDPDIAASMVALATAKQWRTIRISGTPEFRREVWLQARLKGLEVEGFSPSDLDVARLKELSPARALNTISVATPAREIVRQLSSSEPAATGKSTSTDRSGPQPYDYERSPEVFRGQLVHFGRAHLDFDLSNAHSYFIKLDTSRGTKIHWGSELEDVMVDIAKRGRGIGDIVALKPSKDAKLELDPAIHRQSEMHPLDPSQTPEALEARHKTIATTIAQILKERGYSEKTIGLVMAEGAKRIGMEPEAMQRALAKQQAVPAHAAKVVGKSPDKTPPSLERSL